jgi:hypothetical protein
MADELRNARIATNPLRVKLELRPNAPQGKFVATLRSDDNTPTILNRVELLIGQGPTLPAEPLKAVRYGNAYLSNDQISLDEQFADPPTYPTNGDLLVVRVVGRPANGEEQSREFFFRIMPDRTLKDLAAPNEPLVAFA